MNKEIDKDKLQMYNSIVRITIVLCWLSLFFFWGIKILGGNWFEIAVSNENFVKFSSFIQNSWLKYLVSFITIFIAKYLTLCAVCQEFRFKGIQQLVAILGIISIWAVCNFVPSSFYNLPFWYGYLFIIVFTAIYQKGWRKLSSLVSIVLEIAFSTISMLIRNIRLAMIDDYLLLFILSIDVFIMYFLYYLHANLNKIKRGCKNGSVVG